ncbi:MAG: hypothetical protein J6Y85_03885 [Alphaproteobacteria bacterium]|nr:hypothetical protein [Alphaproteobacteria bacterium]
MKWNELSGKTIGIWGMGREGLAAKAALLNHVPDAKIIEVSEDNLSDLFNCQVVIKSPGVSLYRPEIQQLHDKGIAITSNTNLYFANKADKTKVGCITGTKGKSTTSALLAHTIQALGKSCCLGGNIGKPLLNFVDEAPDYMVAETSSYQCADLNASPDLGILVAMYSAHLTWHGSLEQYRADKMNMIKRAKKSIDILSLDVHAKDGYFYEDNQRLFGIDALPLYGAHNLQNACVVLQAIKELGLNPAKCEQAFRTFKPLPHRLQKVAEKEGVLYINDSIATLPEPVIAAMDTFAGRPITLIVGGWDAGYDYKALNQEIQKRGVLALALPDTGSQITTPFHVANMAEAVHLAREKTPVGGVILMSPGAPSYNQYKNFEERGLDFINLVNAL